MPKDCLKLSKRAALEKHTEKPMRRGFIGFFFYHLGMLISRLAIRFEICGLENLPREGSYLIAANHETYVDGMWILSCLPKAQAKRFCCIGAQDLLSKYGFFGRVIMRVGRGIPINRFGSPIRALNAAKAALDANRILLIHPEGTRTRNGKLGRIQEGACFIAKKAARPVVPCFLDGGYEIFSRYMNFPRLRDPKTGRKSRLIIRFGEPLRPEQYANMREMNQALRDWLHRAFEAKEVPRAYDPALIRKYPEPSEESEADAEARRKTRRLSHLAKLRSERKMASKFSTLEN